MVKIFHLVHQLNGYRTDLAHGTCKRSSALKLLSRAGITRGQLMFGLLTSTLYILAVVVFVLLAIYVFVGNENVVSAATQGVSSAIVAGSTLFVNRKEGEKYLVDGE